MFCKNCGTQLADGTTFCTACGAKQEAAAPQVAMGETVVITQQPVQVPVQPAQPVQQQYAQPVQQQPAQPVQQQYAQPVQQQYAQPQYAQQAAYTYPGAAPAGREVSFGEAIKLFFVNYVNFTGRATRSEYWWAYLFNFLVSLATSWIPVLGGIVSLGMMIPGLSLGVRRLHDTGKSWVYLLMGLIPLAGVIILIVQYCKPSDGDNQWGPAPLR